MRVWGSLVAVGLVIACGPFASPPPGTDMRGVAISCTDDASCVAGDSATSLCGKNEACEGGSCICKGLGCGGT